MSLLLSHHAYIRIFNFSKPGSRVCTKLLRVKREKEFRPYLVDSLQCNRDPPRLLFLQPSDVHKPIFLTGINYAFDLLYVIY